MQLGRTDVDRVGWASKASQTQIQAGYWRLHWLCWGSWWQGEMKVIMITCFSIAYQSCLPATVLSTANQGIQKGNREERIGLFPLARVVSTVANGTDSGALSQH